MTTTNMASYTFPLDIIVITDTSLLKEKASKSIFSQFLNLFTLSGTRYSWCPNIINYGPYMHNEWARTVGTTSEEGRTRKPSWASQVPRLLFLYETEAQRAEKIFFWRPASPPHLFKVLDDHPPWIRHCQWICVLIMRTTCLVPVRCLPRPSRSMHFSVVSKMNGLKDSLRPCDLKHIGCAQ